MSAPPDASCRPDLPSWPGFVSSHCMRMQSLPKTPTGRAPARGGPAGTSGPTGASARHVRFLEAVGSHETYPLPEGGPMATADTTRRARRPSFDRSGILHGDETKLSLRTTEFWAMVGVIAAILIASAVSDSLGDVRAWTLVAAVAIGYMISRGLAKSGTKYIGNENTLHRESR
jgi:hypothetical protein